MPYSIAFDREARRAVIRGVGTVDLATGLGAVVSLMDDPRLEEGYGVLVDIRDVDYTPSLAEARHLAGLGAEAERLRRHRVAFVTATQTHFSAAHMVATLAAMKGVVAKAFRALDEAEGWLAASG